MRSHKKVPKECDQWEALSSLLPQSIRPSVAVPGIFVGGGAPSSVADRCLSLCSLFPPLAAVASPNLPGPPPALFRECSLPLSLLRSVVVAGKYLRFNYLETGAFLV